MQQYLSTKLTTLLRHAPIVGDLARQKPVDQFITTPPKSRNVPFCEAGRRFACWAYKKVWQQLFTAIQEPDWEWVLVDSSGVKVYPQAAGVKKKPNGKSPQSQ